MANVARACRGLERLYNASAEIRVSYLSGDEEDGKRDGYTASEGDEGGRPVQLIRSAIGNKLGQVGERVLGLSGGAIRQEGLSKAHPIRRLERGEARRAFVSTIASVEFPFHCVVYRPGERRVGSDVVGSACWSRGARGGSAEQRFRFEAKREMG